MSTKFFAIQTKGDKTIVVAFKSKFDRNTFTFIRWNNAVPATAATAAKIQTEK